MIEHKEHFHGSDLEKIEKTFGIKKEDITSLSANVNPLGISFLLRDTLASHINAITSYPDREYTSLRKAIAAYARTRPENIIVGNGSTELISLFIQFLSPEHTLLMAPTYSEYERELSICGGDLTYYVLKEENNFSFDFADFKASLKEDTNLLIICNPNNPTSACIKNTEIEKLLALCKENNTFVLIDETYVEFTENMEEITAIPMSEKFDNLIILRGISKFFAAPGLRLGYAVCTNHALLRDVNQKQNPWSINSLASIAGEIMFKDQDYINKTRELISLERRRVVSFLKGMPAYKVYDPSANFVLVRIEKEGLSANEIFETAIQKGLMIRNCKTFPFLNEKYFRFCFMLPSKNDELLEVLHQLGQSDNI